MSISLFSALLRSTKIMSQASHRETSSKLQTRWLSSVLCISLAYIGLSSTHMINAHAKGWENIGVYDNVKVSRKTVEGSSLFAFRGVTTADIPLDILIATFTNPKQRRHWVNRYKEHVTIKKTELSETYWIHFKLPPLVSNRDYVLRSDATINKDTGVIEVRIKSVKHPKYPPDCCVRAEVKGTYYKFTAISATRTKLEVEVHTDPKGLLPSWLVNIIQKKWPSKTLSGLIKRARKVNQSHAKTKDWLNKKFPAN